MSDQKCITGQQTLTREEKLAILAPHEAMVPFMQKQKEIWQRKCLAEIQAIPAGQNALYVVAGDRRCGRTTMAKKIQAAYPGTEVLVTGARNACEGATPSYKFMWDQYTPREMLIIDNYEHMDIKPESFAWLIAATRVLVLLGQPPSENDLEESLLQKVALDQATRVFVVNDHIEMLELPDDLPELVNFAGSK